MKDLITLFRSPTVSIPTLVAAVIGAALGAMAFYNGWLG